MHTQTSSCPILNLLMAFLFMLSSLLFCETRRLVGAIVRPVLHGTVTLKIRQLFTLPSSGNIQGSSNFSLLFTVRLNMENDLGTLITGWKASISAVQLNDSTQSKFYRALRYPRTRHRIYATTLLPFLQILEKICVLDLSYLIHLPLILKH
jgi:hypothetical protein